MTRLPKTILEFIHTTDLTPEEHTRLENYMKSTPGTIHHGWTHNSVYLIEYNVYESWCRHEQDLLLVERFREIMDKK